MEILKNANYGDEVVIRNSNNRNGSISDLAQVETSSYREYGEYTNCVILNSKHSKYDKKGSTHVNKR